MSSLHLTPLIKTLPIITEHYRSIGVKSLIIKKQDSWMNVFTNIQISKRNPSDLVDENKHIEDKIGNVDLDNIKIKFQAFDISHFKTLYNDIKNGFMILGDSTITLRGKVDNLDSKTYAKYHSYIPYGEIYEYDTYGIHLDAENPPSRYLQINGFSPTIFGFQDFRDIGRSWFGTDNFNTVRSLNILVPLYAKINYLRYSPPNSITADIKLHEKLIDETRIWIIRKTGTNTPRIISRQSYQAKAISSNLQDGFAYLSFEHQFVNISSTDNIEITLVHDLMGEISRANQHMPFLFGDKTDLLLKSFDLFNAKQKLFDNLTHPNAALDFEVAVTWLLQLFGFKAVNLKFYGEKISEKNEIGSADILAYHAKDNKLFCIDCTVTSPPHDKIDKIKHTSDYVSGNIQLPVRPVIFSAMNCAAAKKDGADIEVLILDKEDIGKLIEIYQQGQNHFPKIHQILY